MFDVQDYQIKHNQLPLYNHRKVEWLLSQLALQQGRFFYWCPVFLSFGIGLYYLLPVEPPLALGAFIMMTSICALLFIKHDNPIKTRVLLALALLPALGFLMAKIELMHIHTPIILEEVGPVTVTGVIETIELTKPDYDARILLSQVTVENLDPQMTPSKVRLRLRTDYDLKVGQRISAMAKLMPPSEPLMPGGFSFRRHLYFQSIGAVGFIYKNVEVLEGTSKFQMQNMIETARHKVTEKIYNVLPPEKAGVATALMNGYRAGLSDDEQDVLREAGLAHLLAISGLHIGLVCGAIFFFLRLVMASCGNFALHHPIKKYAAIAALVGGLLYMFLAGATVPTQRAMLMSAVVFGAIIIDRSPISLRLVAFAAFVVLIISPYSLLSASFQLSFAAVTALIAFYEWMRPRLKEWRRDMNGFQRFAYYFIGIAMTSLIAGTATAPYALYHFQAFATYGLLGNMMAIPIMAFWVMPMAIVSLITMPFGLEYAPLSLMGFGIGQILDIATFVSELEGAVLHVPSFSFSTFLGMVCGLLFFILWQGALRFGGLAMFVIASCFIYSSNMPIILVSSTNKLIAITEPLENFRVNTSRREKFVRENWEQSYGLEKDSSKIIGYTDLDKCDDLGCRTEISGKKIAYTLSQYVHKEDCNWADIIIATDPILIKCNAKVIDTFDVHRNGSHAVYLRKDELAIQSVRDEMNIKRPWNGIYTTNDKFVKD